MERAYARSDSLSKRAFMPTKLQCMAMVAMAFVSTGELPKTGFFETRRDRYLASGLVSTVLSGGFKTRNKLVTG